MIIKELYLGHFGKFHNKTVELKNGLNIIYGKNEAGKSTIHSFIRGMLFGIEKSRGRSSKEELYSKYEPWDTPGMYQGSMLLQIGDKEYRISRSFYKKEKRLQVAEIASGKVIDMDEAMLTELLQGLTDSVYRNTVSIEQLKAKTELGLAQELKNHITNLSTTKSTEVNVQGALSQLLEQKKQIDKKMPLQEISDIEKEIEEISIKVKQQEELTKQLADLMKQSEILNRKIAQFSDVSTREKISKIAMLPLIREKYNTYKNLKLQKEQIEERISVIEDRCKKPVGELDNTKQIQQHLSQLQELRQQKIGLEDEVRHKREQWESQQVKQKINLKRLSMFLMALGAFICVVPVGNDVIRCSIGVFIAFLGIIQYAYKATKDEHSLKYIDDIEKSFEREVFKLHSIRHDILLSHRVSNETQLILKYNDMTKSETEREQFLDRKAEYMNSLEKLREQTEALEQEITNYMYYFIVEPELSDNCMEELSLLIQEYKEETLQEKSKYEEEKAEIKTQIDRIRWTLDMNRSQDEVLMQKEQKLKELKELDSELKEDSQAIQLSIETLKELSSSIHELFGSELNERVSMYISDLSNHEYTHVMVSEDLSIKVLGSNGYVDVNQLSAGTMDQMYLALRLAVSDLLFPQQKLPIILDDAFALYDDERTENALELLSKQKERQIIVLTCHEREMLFIKHSDVIANIIEI